MAITDVFFRRYRGVPIAEYVSEDERRFLNQAVKLMGDRLWLAASDVPEVASEETEKQLKVIHDKLALELGVDFLSPQMFQYGATWQRFKTSNIIRNFMVQQPQANTDADAYLKDRLSLIELAFRLRGEQVAKIVAAQPAALVNADLKDKKVNARSNAVPSNWNLLSCEAMFLKYTDGFSQIVGELNERMRIAGIGFVYSNGLLHQSSDGLSEDVVAKPFWSVVSHPKWSNVDFHMKEALDKRDRGERDAAFASLQALESTIKIVCADKGWVPPKAPNGASGYLDLLGSKANGNWLADWERDSMKSLFEKVRNPFGHGPGADPVPVLGKETTSMVIDSTMAWIKLLIRRP